MELWTLPFENRNLGYRPVSHTSSVKTPSPCAVGPHILSPITAFCDTGPESTHKSDLKPKP